MYIYRSRFSGRPKAKDFFQETCHQFGERGGKLTYIEIACDTIFKTNQEAIEAYLNWRKRFILRIRIRSVKYLIKQIQTRDFSAASQYI